ncbi:alpha/beta hydrolase [Mycobacterium sp. MUNTM1]
MTESMQIADASIHYTDAGSGRPLVFIHGVYVAGAAWDDVIADLWEHHRCLAPTWPFGAQSEPVGDHVDLGVPAAGQRIAEFWERLHLREGTLVVNDSGGGIVLAAVGDKRPDWSRVAGLVLTNCDSYEHFPPQVLARIVLGRLFPGLGTAVLWYLATWPGRAVFAKSVTRNGIDKHRQSAMFGGFVESAGVHCQAVRFSADLRPGYTAALATAVEEWSKPVLLAWGADDQISPVSHAERLADAFANSTLRILEGRSTYVMLDRPRETSETIRACLRN